MVVLNKKLEALKEFPGIEDVCSLHSFSNNRGLCMSNTSRKLSSDEVSALMEGLQSGDIPANSGLNNDIEVTDFTFGSDNLELLGDYYALRLINERFARLVRSIFLPMIRIQPKINPFPPEVKTYDEYSADLTVL